jgi:hypothetical protein
MKKLLLGFTLLSIMSSAFASTVKISNISLANLYDKYEQRVSNPHMHIQKAQAVLEEAKLDHLFTISSESNLKNPNKGYVYATDNQMNICQIRTIRTHVYVRNVRMKMRNKIVCRSSFGNVLHKIKW